MKVLFFLCTFWVAIGAQAAIDLSIPETVVRISIFDLINKPLKPNIPVYQLPADYGQRVAAKILEKKATLLDCNQGEIVAKRLDLKLDIAGNGRAKVGAEEAETPLLACVRRVLQEIQFPNHGYKHNVSVELPLQLQRKVL